MALGLGFIVTAIVTTFLILVLKEDVAFGVAWELPYVWAGIYMIGTVVFVKRSLKKERRLWNSKTSSSI
jgi:Sec-independent protein secretion pathway component TatC